MPQVSAWKGGFSRRGTVLRPQREPVRNNGQTYFVTAQTWQRRPLFLARPWASLFIETLLHYRPSAYLLHEFVLMPEHFHLLISPVGTLEKSIQFIKGGFSFRAKRELGSNMEVWQKSFTDHRIRDDADYEKHVQYVYSNPVKRRLCNAAIEFPYCSAFPGLVKDPGPQRLKALERQAAVGAPEGAPLQRFERRALKEAPCKEVESRPG
ncbi:MAG TPA: transposase [Clostridia bacterium]|nr:transposase [Clostridia bacterium]